MELLKKPWVLLILCCWLCCFDKGYAQSVTNSTDSISWEWWLVLLFLTSFAIGLLAVMAGAGGGVLFVPIVASYFPPHMDFVRGAGILVALSTALAAAPSLLKSGMASIKLSIPSALVASIFSILGVVIGSSIPVQQMKVALGVVILAVVMVMLVLKSSNEHRAEKPDGLGNALGLYGRYYEPSSGQWVSWSTKNTLLGLILFSGVGLMAGMFGMGAGWANVPVLNLLMGVPVKVAVSTSILILAVTDTAAAWEFLHQGAVLPMLIVPCLAGVMMGSRLGVILFKKAKPGAVRYLVIVLLLLAGSRSLYQGMMQ